MCAGWSGAPGLVVVFFTASGNRHSYYVLPLVPFAQLLAAWWVSERLAAKRRAGRVGERVCRCGPC